MAFGNTVQARVDLDITPFRRGLLSAQSELGKFSNKLSAGKVLTSILSGVGIGSGFAIAEKAAGMIASYWEKAAKAAESVAAFSERSADAVTGRLRDRNTPEQNLAFDRKEEARLFAEAGTNKDPVAAAEALAKANELQRKNDAVERKLAAEAQAKLANAEQTQEAKLSTAKAARAALERKIAFDQIDAAGKIAWIEDEILENAMAIANAQDPAARLEAENRRIELFEEIRKIKEEDEQATEAAAKKALDAELALRAEKEATIAIVRKKEAEANQARSQASAAYATANRDRVAFTVDAAAAGRGTSTEQRRAQRILQLEAQARQAYDSNYTTETRDQSGNRITETGEQRSARLLAQADKLRGDFGSRLNSADRNPMAAAQKTLDDSLAELKSIAAALAASGTQ